MKVLKNVFLVIGLLVILGAAGVLVKNAWDLRVLYEVAMANKSQPSVTNPTNLVLIGAALAVGGGVLLGLGIGLPRRTAGAIRTEALADYQHGIEAPESSRSGDSANGFEAHDPESQHKDQPE